MERPIIIVGAGVIGLSIGRELVHAGKQVLIYDRDEAGRGASWTAGGMLAPDAELGFEEMDLYRFSRESLDRWPAYAASIEQESGQSIKFRTEGTLIVADDQDSAKRLRRLYDFQKEQGCEVEWLSGAEARAQEPYLAPRLVAAVYAPKDYQVENRSLLQALKKIFVEAGGILHEHTPVQRLIPDEQTPSIVTESGDRVEADKVILAAGAWSRKLEGLEPEARPPVRPVKGQMIELRVKVPFDLTHVIRGSGAYLIPKGDGRLLVGATSEEMGFDMHVTAGGLFRMLEGAWEIVPGIEDLDVTDMWVGLRPASRDHAPLLGNSSAPGIIFATGHYRHGILLTPITAQEIAHLVLQGETSKWIELCSPLRFVKQPH